ncbi:MAG: DUF2497 domain-containing protein [Sphingomonas sp.]|uniref:DUF2497 domain-containing protein n=1 Tax=Sphingomonas sp. TaxID=28214 RepID=UPI00184631C1|nr:DUF2497 domain-containing protein [Sphingomonas sp.]MBA3666957.1 DUF2497 domain-containing protein [Sphingomonas sp.]
MAAAREPSMEDILASIKRVIAEEKEIRAAAPPPSPVSEDDDILELDETMAAEPLAPPVDLGPPLVADALADSSRLRIEELVSVAAAAPPPPTVNPLEELVREMLRPILKQWLDDHLPGIVDEHVKREITRITGRPV